LKELNIRSDKKRGGRIVKTLLANVIFTKTSIHELKCSLLKFPTQIRIRFMIQLIFKIIYNNEISRKDIKKNRMKVSRGQFWVLFLFLLESQWLLHISRKIFFFTISLGSFHLLVDVFVLLRELHAIGVTEKLNDSTKSNASLSIKEKKIITLHVYCFFFPF